MFVKNGSNLSLKDVRKVGVLPKKLDRIILILEKNIAELLRSEVFLGDRDEC